MPQEISWLIENQVILGQAWGKPEKESLQEYNDEVNRLLDEAQSEKVFLVYDGREAEGMPPIRAFQSFTFPQHPKFKGVIILRAMNPVLNFMASATTQIAKVRAYFANTPDDVFEILHGLIPDLSDTAAYRRILDKVVDDSQAE